jgi:DNA invertase Pin-like site-specific DNA recombinase
MAISAVAYYRMSTDKQEDSIDRQRSQVEPYAARRGYTIVRDYLDEGISGDEQEKRKGFMRMLKDAQRGDFAIIVCDDKDRFGRFDTIDYGYYVKPLRDAGIQLDAVAQGMVDWSSFAGRISDAVLQEAKKLESQAISRRVLTRFLMMAQEGKWFSGKTPYGYCKTKDLHLVEGDPSEVRVVHWLFETYAHQQVSLRWMATELEARGVLNPTGGTHWCPATIRDILIKRVYVGDYTWGIEQHGKYHAYRGGQIEPAQRRPTRGANAPEQDWIIRLNNHPALIDRETFERVQGRLASNQRRTSPHGRTDHGFFLTGLLVCGHCGSRMFANSTANYKDRGKRERRFYRCGGYHDYGKRVCHAHSIGEEALLACVIRRLQDDFLNPDNLQRLRDELRRQAEATARTDPNRTKHIRSQINKLARQIDQGTERLAVVDKDLLPDLAAKVRSWKEQRGKLQLELAILEKGPEAEGIAEQIRVAEEQLWNLRNALTSANAAEVRGVLREFVDRVELTWSCEQLEKKTRCKPAGGVIVLREDEHLDRSGDFFPLVHNARA